MDCYRDWQRANPAPPRVRESRATGAPLGRPQPQSHPWRKLIGRDVELARAARERREAA